MGNAKEVAQIIDMCESAAAPNSGETVKLQKTSRKNFSLEL
jgi:hypothetical protein